MAEFLAAVALIGLGSWIMTRPEPIGLRVFWVVVMWACWLPNILAGG